MVTSVLSLYFLLAVAQVGSAGASGAPAAAGVAPPSSAGAGSSTSSGVTAPPSATAMSPTAGVPGDPSQGGTSSGGSPTSTSTPGTGLAGQPTGTTGVPLTLTLQEVVNLAVANNTNVVLAKQRLQEAAEGINQVNAFGLPQLNGTIADTYSSFAESSANYSTLVTNPTLPGGSVIPTVVDEAAEFPTSFGLGTVSGGGGASGSGTLSPATGTSLSLPANGATTLPEPTSGSGSTTALPASGTSGSSGAGTGVTSSPISSTSGTTTTSPGTSTVAPSTGGSTTTTVTPGTTTTSPTTNASPTGTSSSMSTGGATTSGAAFELAPMPSLLQDYVTEVGAPEVIKEVSTPDVSSPSEAPSQPDAEKANVAPANGGARMADQDTGTTGGGTTTTTTTPGEAAVIGKTSVNNYGGRLYLSQYVDAFGLLSAERDAERLTTEFYAIDVDRNENEVALSAKNLYFNVILAQQDVATDQEAVADATESVRVTSALVNQGQAAGFDLLSAQTTLANDQQQLEAATVNYQDAASELDYLLGVSPNTSLNLTVPPLPPLNSPVDLAQSTRVALQRRPEIMQANENVTLANKLVKVATAGTTPTVGLVGEYGYNSESTVSGPQNEGLVSAQISLPIEDGGATRSRVREAKVVVQSQVTTKNELQLNVQLEVRQAYLSILEGQSSVSTAQTAVALAVETLRVANVQYQNGVGTILDVENAQAQLATARTNLSNAQFTYETALAALVRDIGSR